MGPHPLRTGFRSGGKEDGGEEAGGSGGAGRSGFLVYGLHEVTGCVWPTEH